MMTGNPLILAHALGTNVAAIRFRGMMNGMKLASPVD
jgi:hypothetical protein